MSKKNRVVPKTVNLKDVAFAYFSTCCDAGATKPVCAVPSCAKIGTTLGSVPNPDERNTSLGSWRCGSCRKGCKVRRVKKEVIPTPTSDTFVSGGTQ